MTKIDLTPILKKYTSGWVALSSDYKRVIATAQKISALQDKIKGKKNVVVIQAFDNYYNFVS